MNDPHVVALIYKIEHGPSVDYSKAEPLDRKETNFRVQITNEEVRFFEFKEHYAAEDVARGAIEDYIRAWEFDAGLRGGPNYFKLKFAGAQIKDRNPTPGVISGPAIEGDLDGSISATLLVLPPYYPPPPSGVMLITPDVQTMYDRYMGSPHETEKKARIVGTDLIGRVDLIKNNEIIYTISPRRSEAAFEFAETDPTPGESYYYVRVMQEDGEMAWGSPAWVTYGK